MDHAHIEPARRRRFRLHDGPGEGEAAGIELGPTDRPIDVVFLHANGFNALTYRSILAPLAGEMRILAVDLRGHGRSTLPADPEGRTGWGPFKEDLLALLRQLGGPPPVMSGHSMGGCTSLLAAAVAPELIRRMVFFDPVILPRARLGQTAGMHESPLVAGALRRRARFDSKEAALTAYLGRGAFRTWRPEMVADYVEDGFRPSPEGGVELSCTPAWEAANFMAHDHDPWPGLETFPGRIRILRAETGSTASIDSELDALTADGRIEVETIPGTSHFLPMERPDLVHAELRKAVAG